MRCSHALARPRSAGPLAEIRDNLIARIAEAEREGWLGEVEGLKISLAGARRQAHPDRPAHLPETAVNIGMPSTTTTISRSWGANRSGWPAVLVSPVAARAMSSNCRMAWAVTGLFSARRRRWNSSGIGGFHWRSLSS